MRLFVTQTEAHWLLRATQQHKDALGDGSLKSAMGKAALEDLERKLVEQIGEQLPVLDLKEKKR